MKQRILNLLIAFDQLVYVILTLGVGHPDETLSAAAWRTEQKNRLLGIFFRPVIDFIFRPFEQNHCYKAFKAEKNGSQLPKEYQV